MGARTCVVLAIVAASCAARTDVETWTAAPPPAANQVGRVESVREVATENTAAASAGAVLGGLLGGIVTSSTGLSMLFGVVIGGVTGAVIAPMPPKSVYEVLVRFDDGSTRTYDYDKVAPFAPGDRVIVGESGLVRG